MENTIRLVKFDSKNNEPAVEKTYQELLKGAQEWIKCVSNDEDRSRYHSWFLNDKKRFTTHCYQEQQNYQVKSNSYPDLLDFLYVESGAERIIFASTVTIEQLRDFSDDGESETKEALISTIKGGYGLNSTRNYVNHMSDLKRDLTHHCIEFKVEFVEEN